MSRARKQKKMMKYFKKRVKLVRQSKSYKIDNLRKQ